MYRPEHKENTDIHILRRFRSQEPSSTRWKKIIQNGEATEIFFKFLAYYFL